ncbi:hypothetical protein SAMD00019534_107900 [Acytostelium subglobosum LB1]|uniref:hypothetical protein n=1 Tax=Acytostelium subglobosum LB1 TaxID=1410327 RepID=UPI0006451890|nr:hypothetical protein SAMD00019534_107900 [Acytostelium subglobosum LB1]GAM27614.1 hypothetical protein SAMD00019534_107900 [Acytostelium subglobosum LB1]|eukprot:XP_012749273.1 hypothetical protein SAMD00019534_107900 [Acytostelium subglobosum LB1]
MGTCRNAGTSNPVISWYSIKCGASLRVLNFSKKGVALFQNSWSNVILVLRVVILIYHIEGRKHVRCSDYRIWTFFLETNE